MGSIARIVDLNQIHDNSESITYVNDFDISDVKERDRLQEMLLTHYEGDTLSIVPQCQCKAVSGTFNIGVKCQLCGTVVMAVTERPLESALWLRPPKGVEVFINPMFWMMFSNALRVGGVDVFRYVTDPSYVVSKDSATKVPSGLFEYKDRGLNSFYHNFEDIMGWLEVERLMTQNKELKETMIELVQENRDKIFVKALPVPSNLNFITEKTVTGTYADNVMTPMIDAVHTISQTDHSVSKLSERTILGRAARANGLIATFYSEYIKKHFTKKVGWFRKHEFGGRLAFTMRAVITSLAGVHAYDELHLPWSASVGLFKIHLISKLLRRGYTPNQAVQFVHEYTARYHPLMDELFQEIIYEAPGHAPTVILNRNNRSFFNN